MNIKLLFLTVLSVYFLLYCAVPQKSNKALVSEARIFTASSDSAKKPVLQHSSKLKPYNVIIPSTAVTQKGLFTVHQVADSYYWEIPDSLLQRDLLISGRIVEAAADIRPGGGAGGSGFAGDITGPKIIQFRKGPGDKLFISINSFAERSSDSNVNGMYNALKKSSLIPITAVLDIKTYLPAGGASVVDVTEFIKGDNIMLYFTEVQKGRYGLGALQSDKSYIQSIYVNPEEVNIQAVKTYLIGTKSATYTLHTRIVTLPKRPMVSRMADLRVGYGAEGYTSYDGAQGIRVNQLITRWRLEPRPEDEYKYLQGELVDPQQPIVYYIDPTTPKKWVPYIMQGVIDWQVAFENAGFKRAIYAKEIPLKDSLKYLSSTCHNLIVYSPSTERNAMGRDIHDPRTGEILESHINISHGILALAHDWYMIQAGPNDPRARKMILDDTLMGRLLRYIVSHEVGHTLGLPHNFIASSSIPTDSLRSKQYLAIHGICPSIMDYARVNYVAQPEDSIQEENLLPKIGEYDKWAIDFGYRWYPPFVTPEAEKTFMNQRIVNQLKKGEQYRFSTSSTSPGSLGEDLGDDPIKSGLYGIKNLHRVKDRLVTWTVTPGKDYGDLRRMHQQVLIQYGLYLNHVLSLIGGYSISNIVGGDTEPTVHFIPKSQQQQAVVFLLEQLFNTPVWLTSGDLFNRIGGDGANTVAIQQTTVISDLLRSITYTKMTYSEAQNPKDFYSYDELLTDLEQGIWHELTMKKAITYERRNLQILYAEQLIAKGPATTLAPGMTTPAANGTAYWGVKKKHIRLLIRQIAQALPGYRDAATRLHLETVRDLLREAMGSTTTTSSNTGSPQAISADPLGVTEQRGMLHCWGE